MTYKTNFTVLILFLCFSFNGITEEDEVHHDNHDAHVHGLATLTLVLENNLLEIQLESPAVNLVGFEHRASSAKEKQIVQKTHKMLQSPENLFFFKNSQCEVKKATVDVSDVVADEHEHHEHHSNHEQHETHSEIVANYQIHCDNIKKHIAISTSLFERFPALEKIDAIWVTETSQGAQTLHKKKNEFHLK